MESVGNLRINRAMPKHSQYATEESRIASFNGWPNTHTLAMPDTLAIAGFFYTGSGDGVRCFCCGIVLGHWMKEDDPWIEHARWSRSCIFVKQKKGEDFITLVQLAAEYTQDNVSMENAGGNQSSAQSINMSLFKAAQDVLEMGYQVRIIKMAVEEICRQNREWHQSPCITGEAETIAELLVDKILVLEKSGFLRTDTSAGAISDENKWLKMRMTCKICLDKMSCVVFLPCGDLTMCEECAQEMISTYCPVCNTLIRGTVIANYSS